MKKLAALLIVSLLVSVFSLPLDIQAFRMNKKIGALVEQNRSVATNLGLFGGKANDVAIDTTSDNVYMTTMAPNGLFVSRDNGVNWTGLPDTVNYGTGTAVEVDSSGNVYAIVGDDLLKSSDKGASFSEITSKIGNGLGSVLLFAQNKLLVGISGGVAISSDGGTSFSKATIESGAMIKSIASSPTSGTFYAVTSQNNSSEKLYKSTDGGNTWSDMAVSSKNGVPAGQRIDVVAVNPQNANHIIISQTGGASANSLQTIDGGLNNWSAITSNGQNVSSNHITFDGTGRLYMLKAYTTDNGATWTTLNNNTPSSTLFSDTMAIDPGNPNLIFTNSGMGIARSTDRGLNWIDSTSGVTSVKTYDIAQADNKKYVWIGADGGLGRTSNFTASSPDWQYPIVSGFQGSTVFAVWIKPDNPDVVVSGDGQFIRRTTNATASNPSSVSWSQVATINVPGAASPGGNVVEIVSHPTNNNLLYAAHTNDDRAGSDTGAVLKSNDAGATWTNLNIPGNVPATSLTVAKDGDVYVGTGGDSSTGVYKYSGGSWSKLSGGFPSQKVSSVLADPENANIVLATVSSDPGSGSNQGGLYKSTNGGSSWSKITNGLTKVNNLDSLTAQTSTSPNTFYVAGQDQSGGSNSLNGAIYKSADGGQSWGQYYVGLKQESFYALMFDGLTAGNDRGLYDIKSKASVSLTVHQRIIKKVKRKGKVRNKVVYKKIKTAKKGQVVSLKIALADAATKKKLKNRAVILYKKVGKKWKKIKKAKLNKYGYVFINTRMSKTAVYYALWKPGNKADKAEYTTSKSKNVKVKVRRK